MAINFPNNPSDGDTYLAGNGINYIWVDATDSWQVYNDPASGAQVWSRDPAEAELLPLYNGDSVVVQTAGGVDAVTVGSDGNVTATGKFIGDVDIESFPALP